MNKCFASTGFPGLELIKHGFVCFKWVQERVTFSVLGWYKQFWAHAIENKLISLETDYKIDVISIIIYSYISVSYVKIVLILVIK